MIEAFSQLEISTLKLLTKRFNKNYLDLDVGSGGFYTNNCGVGEQYSNCLICKKNFLSGKIISGIFSGAIAHGREHLKECGLMGFL